MTAKIGYNVDSFGHHGNFPQLLRLSGMEGYVFMRPMPDEKGLPARVFMWQSDDGSQIPTFRIPTAYCIFSNLDTHIDDCIAELEEPLNSMMCFYGVGNHGGGPTIENIKTILSKQQQYAKSDVDIIFSDPNRFFADIEPFADKLPVVHDDLQHHSIGCYTAHAQVKALNRKAENALVAAEKYSVIAAAVKNQPYADFNQAWKNVLFNQFHDILAGTSIEPAYDDAIAMYGESLSVASRSQNYAIQALSFDIDIPQEECRPVVAFNPHSWPVNAPIEFECGMFENTKLHDAISIVDSAGNVLPHQTIAPVSMSWNTRVVFNATIPPMGYATFRAIKADAPATTIPLDNPYTLENSEVKLTLDPMTGCPSSLIMKDGNADLFSAKDSAAAAIINDHSDTWSHGIKRFDEVIGQFKAVSVDKTEKGLVRESIRVISKYGDSTLVQTYTLYAGKPDIHVKATLNWQEKHKLLKLRYPLELQSRKATYEIPYGSITRECNGEEEPMQNWFDLNGIINGTRFGLAILNDGKYGGDVCNNVMSMTILRSPVYAHHLPAVITGSPDEYSYMDQGITRFNYVLSPYKGRWQDNAIVQKGHELNQPISVLIESCHKGSLPQTNSFLSIDAQNIILTALKQSEDKSSTIARIYETAGKRTNFSMFLHFLNKRLVLNIEPYKIKTYKITADGEVTEVNLLEE